MFYTIYKITNKINDKEYIGKHQTVRLDDDYMGSGKLLKSAYAKYGIENFIKETLFVFDNEDEMNRKEAELVTEDYCSRSDTYNICPGGQGGWGHININGINLTEKHAEAAKKNLKKATDKFVCLMKDEKWNSSFRKTIKETHCSKKDGYVNPFKNKRHSQSFIDSLKGHKNQCGEKNSQFGTCWITNGSENRKIKKEELDKWTSLGYNKGRVILG